MTEQWFRQLDKAALGNMAESIVENACVESRVRVVMLHRIETGRAPCMEGKRDRIVLPDLELFSSCSVYKYTCYLDVKGKKSAIVFRKRNQRRHGIDFDKLEAYKDCAALAEKPAGLFVVECFMDETHREWSGALLVQSLKVLGEPLPEEQRERPRKVYWPRKAFRELGRFTPEQFGEMARGAWVPSFEDQLCSVFVKFKQSALF